MSRTEYHTFDGILSWVNVHQPDKYNKYGCLLHPNDESLERIRDLQARGLKNQMKKDDDGYYIRIGSPVSRVYKGTVKGFAPPLLLQADGLTPLLNTPVGNGSQGSCSCEVYGYTDPVTKNKGIAWRLKAIRINNLVPFEMRRDFTETQARAVQGIDEPAPENLF